MITRDQIYVDKKTGMTEWRKIAGVQEHMSELENSAEIISFKCNDKGVLFSHKKYYQVAKNFKARFILCH